MNERDSIRQLWHAANARGQRAALATVCEVKGSAYRRPGARMLLCSDGQSAGVINGGCLDADLWRRAREVMASGGAQMACYDTTSSQDIVWGLGLGCRGVVKILVEPAVDLDWLRDEASFAVNFQGADLGTRVSPQPVERAGVLETSEGRAFVQRLEPPQTLLIFGAGADVLPLFALGRLLGWNVQVADPRARRPEDLEQLVLPPRAAIVLMTHNFLHDLEILRWALRSPAFYVGVLGPKRRADELLAALPRDGILPGLKPTEEQLARLHAPVGLDIGAETPEEIALSIVAELCAAATGRDGGLLRAREAPIHEASGAEASA